MSGTLRFACSISSPQQAHTHNFEPLVQVALERISDNATGHGCQGM